MNTNPTIVSGAEFSGRRMTFREQAARAMVRRRAKKMFSQGAPAFASEDALFEDMWAKDLGLFRGSAFADVDAALNVLNRVDHAFLDAARDGLPLDSGTAARFWLRCLAAIAVSAAARADVEVRKPADHRDQPEQQEQHQHDRHG